MIEGVYKTSSPQTGQERLKLDAVENGPTVHFRTVLCGCLSTVCIYFPYVKVI